MSGGAAAGAAAGVAAAKRAAELRQEEEDLTGYSAEDLEGWEFKIVRASTRRFRTAEAVKQLRDEEAKAGWEMVEKFDDSRIRFKRTVENRSRDQYLDINPYRTTVGLGEGAIVALVLGIIAVVGAIVALVASAAR